MLKLAAAVAAALLLLSNSYAAVFTYKITGTLDGFYNYDNLKLFGGGSLAGKDFVLTVGLDADELSSGWHLRNWNYASGPARLNVTASVNGFTYSTSTVAELDSSIDIQNYAFDNPSSVDSLSSYAMGKNAIGYFVSVSERVVSFADPFIGPSNDFSAIFSYAPALLNHSLYSSFLVVDPQTLRSTWIDAYKISRIDVNEVSEPANEVPEPSSLALSCLGILGAYVARRRTSPRSDSRVAR